MGNYYLAIDIGASSGRHILGHLENGKLMLEEIHRFVNGMTEKDGELCWDLTGLFQEIKLGMRKCKEAGKVPVSVGIDTWGVDFVLLDKEDHIIGNTVAYRDSRTTGMDDKVYSVIPEDKLYTWTGIQKQIFNTIYQLMAVKEQHPDYLDKAENLLMIPDYFHFLLSGVKRCEYTNATTTQLVNPITKDWDKELIDMLGYPRKIFTQIDCPATVLGNLTKEIREEVGFDCSVVLPATHDTGSAVIAVPSNQSNPLYISSGTWSLMGTERYDANCSALSKSLNLTNEGGYDYRFRYLKNIMGLWMIQSVKKEIGQGYSYGEICEMASKKEIPSIVNCNDNRFLAPASMTQEVRKACAESNQPVPEGMAEVAAVIYNSLAKCYKSTVEELEEITKLTFDSIHVVGGGANAEYLNELTARFTGRKVLAGPTEATATGNILVQMITGQELKDLAAARECVRNSFEIKEYV
ncbi:MAG TPA: rhamnulokinase [Mobilitalea sp.]|nr:rhamnulokinase [Mobilitalea sp.]